MVGNVSSQQAWEALSTDADALLVDVRTTAEWSYVGVPDLGVIGKRATLIVWQDFPSGEINPQFRAELERVAAGAERDGVGQVQAALVRVRLLRQVGRRAKAQAVGTDNNLRREAAGADGGLLRQGRLGRLELEIAGELDAELVDAARGKVGGEAQN